MRQHLAAVKACATISGAKAQGASINSRELSFEPGEIRGGGYQFAVGSAGSATLILQTILLPLLSASTPSLVELEGGTHNPWAPPFDFIEKTFLPLLRQLGARVELKLIRPGFYPAGGGKIVAEIHPSKPLCALDLTSRGTLTKQLCRAIVCGLSGDIAKRELAVVKEQLGWSDSELKIEQLPHVYGPGNVVLAELTYGDLTHVFTGFGERSIRAEDVALGVAEQVQEFSRHNAAVSKHLADQLLIPCIWAGGGHFTTFAPTKHFQTNLSVIRHFVKFDCTMIAQGNDAPDVTIKLC